MDWLMARTFSRYDALWLMLYGALLIKGLIGWAVLVLVVGATSSGFIEAWWKDRSGP